ncbi:MAG: VCBS repeat-containing protein [Armatimonadota bacterium]|nr:VCBS repeat-containing protein [Armatimonadota bacterium]
MIKRPNLLYITLLLLLTASSILAAGPALNWVSPNHYRILLTVDSRGIRRSNSPVSVNVNFVQTLADMGAKGSFDENTIEVVAYDPSGKPRVFDSTRKGYEKYLLPHRIDKYYGVGYVTLNFTLPNETCNKVAVYFDTKKSKFGKPMRYAGLVGDGDYFRIGYSRREIGASHMDDFCDFDGDGDQDLFKVTTEPFIYCYENVGGNKFIDRGKMTSGGSLFMLPRNGGNNRSWAVLEFADWDKDGDQDLFCGFSDSAYTDSIALFENVTVRGGQPKLIDRGTLKTESGKNIGGAWFPAATVVDWDGDGKNDLLVGGDGKLFFHKNIGKGKSLADMRFADAEPVMADGKQIAYSSIRAECADIDNDGDIDLFVSAQGGGPWLYRNTGTRTKPVFGDGENLQSCTGGHDGISVADFDGDGLLDYVDGNLWETTAKEGKRRSYARFYKNIGSKTNPRFEERDALNGCPYTEDFQICDAVRQNTLRVCDWNNDGKTDLIAGGERHTFYYFRNTTNNLNPIFTDNECLLQHDGGSVRSDICDWNNDGKKDILVADQSGYLTIYLNQGTDSNPSFGTGTKIQANGKEFRGTYWCSVLVCDWDNDGKKDVIYGQAIAGNQNGQYDWPAFLGNAKKGGLLFYKNIGTDSEPVLAYPKWVMTGIDIGVSPINCTRPNLGSYADWDGDGKKDFISAEFENVIRLYQNTGDSGPGKEPEFAWPREGIELLRAWTDMTISGVDAKDWNGDGDIDILTGQGHGGTGLRFFEHDYIEDDLNDTHPRVTVEKTERKALR